MMRLTKTLFFVFLCLLISNFLHAQADTAGAKPTTGGQTPFAKEGDSARLQYQKPDTTTQPAPLPAPAPPAAAPAPPAAPKPNTLIVSVDMRMRTELRHGYRAVPLKDTSVAYFINQRTRLNFDYKTKNFDFFASIQDARVWGEQDPREGQGTTSSITATPTTTFPLYLFEGYVEPHFNDRWSVRIGRQRIIYDNQRLFAENDWRLPGNSHDAVRLIYNNKINLNTELLFSFGQSAEQNFTTNYAPNGFKNYKDLLVHFLNYKISKSFVLTTINVMDGYQSAYKYNTTFQRFTSGGRLEYQSYNWYATVAAYYQYGKDSSGKKLSAYYVQPEIKYSSKALSIRLGMELQSGQDTTSTKDNAFVTLYGVAHRFMGNLDLLDAQSDFNNGGIVNPYLFFQYQKNKWTVRLENHLFYSQSNAALKGKPKDDLSKYLGFENDWRVNFKPTPIIDIEYGFCWGTFTNSFVAVKNSVKTVADINKYSKTPYWSYLSLRVTPTIGKFTF